MAEAVTCQEALYYKKDEELDSLVNAITTSGARPSKCVTIKISNFSNFTLSVTFTKVDNKTNFN